MRLYKRAEIARRIGMDSKMILPEFLSGRLPGVKIGANWLATIDDLAKWLGRERAEMLFGDESTHKHNRAA